MKITHRGMEITGIPYFEKITIGTGGDVQLDDGDGEPVTVSREHLFVLRDAFTEALRLQEEITGTPAPPRPAPRVFREGDSEPGPEVTAVIDSINNRWTRRIDGWMDLGSAHPWPRTWSELVDECGSVTEDRHV